MPRGSAPGGVPELGDLIKHGLKIPVKARPILARLGMGPRRVGPKGGAPKGGWPKISRFVSLSRSQFRFFLSWCLFSFFSLRGGRLISFFLSGDLLVFFCLSPWVVSWKLVVFLKAWTLKCARFGLWVVV